MKQQSVKVNYEGGHFPNEKQTLLLKSAVFPNPEAIMYFMEWLRLCGLDKLDIESKTFLSDFMDSLDLGSQRMLPLVIHNVGESNHPYFRFLLGIRKNFWVKNQQTIFYAKKVQQVFDKNSIPCIQIKGLDLASRYYPNDALRPMNDGDILVPYQYKEQALGLAIDGVFGNKIANYDLYLKDFLHAVHLDFSEHIDIDLHWNIFSEYSNTPDCTDFIWENTQTVVINNVSTKRMSETHAFFVSLLHGRNFDTVPPFRWVADTIMIMRSAKTIDWNELLLLTQRFHFKPFLKKAFPYLKQEFNMDIPAPFLLALEKMEVNDLEKKYYYSVSQNAKKYGFLSWFWYRITAKILYHKLFLQNKETSLTKYLLSWCLKRLQVQIIR